MSSLRIPQQVVKAAQYFRSLKGGSQSHLLLGEDNHPYVVKFIGNPQHDRVLINEWVGASLARTLDLPVPKTALIQVSADFLREHPEVCANVSGRTRPYEPGIHFGSRFAGGLMPGLTTDLMPKALSARVANRTQFLGALVFDKWTCNADGRQAVFTKTGTHFVASFIDQGFCFDAEFWTMKDAPLKGLHWNHAVYSEVEGISSFSMWLDRLMALPIDDVWRAFQSVPLEWSRDDAPILQDLAERMCKRRESVTSQLEELHRCKPLLFPAWQCN